MYNIILETLKNRVSEELDAGRLDIVNMKLLRLYWYWKGMNEDMRKESQETVCLETKVPNFITALPIIYRKYDESYLAFGFTWYGNKMAPQP